MPPPGAAPYCCRAQGHRNGDEHEGDRREAEGPLLVDLDAIPKSAPVGVVPVHHRGNRTESLSRAAPARPDGNAVRRDFLCGLARLFPSPSRRRPDTAAKSHSRRPGRVPGPRPVVAGTASGRRRAVPEGGAGQVRAGPPRHVGGLSCTPAELLEFVVSRSPFNCVDDMRRWRPAPPSTLGDRWPGRRRPRARVACFRLNGRREQLSSTPSPRPAGRRPTTPPVSAPPVGSSNSRTPGGARWRCRRAALDSDNFGAARGPSSYGARRRHIDARVQRQQLSAEPCRGPRTRRCSPTRSTKVTRTPALRRRVRRFGENGEGEPQEQRKLSEEELVEEINRAFGAREVTPMKSMDYAGR